MSFLEQNAMETLIRRQVDQLFAQQYLARTTARAKITRANATGLAIPANALFIATMDTEEYDTDNMVDLATLPTRITVKTAGTYVFWSQANVSNPPASAMYLQTVLRFNGVTVILGTAQLSSVTLPEAGFAFDIRPMGVNDYVEAGMVVNVAGVTTSPNVGPLVLGAVRLG